MADRIDAEKIKQYQRAFARERDWEKFHTLKNLAASLSIESNELLEIFQWLNDDQVANVMQDPKAAAKIRDEVADVFYYLIRFSDIAGIDIEDAFWKKTKANEAKYPTQLARGNALKYDELNETMA